MTSLSSVASPFKFDISCLEAVTDIEPFVQDIPIAYASCAMLIRGYERGERVYNSMISRGFNGSIELKKREFKKSYLLY